MLILHSPWPGRSWPPGSEEEGVVVDPVGHAIVSRLHVEATVLLHSGSTCSSMAKMRLGVLHPPLFVGEVADLVVQLLPVVLGILPVGLMLQPLEKLAPLVGVLPMRTLTESAHQDDGLLAVVALGPVRSWRWRPGRGNRNVRAAARGLGRRGSVPSARTGALVLRAFLQALVDGVPKLPELLLAKVVDHPRDLASWNVHRMGHSHLVQDQLAKGVCQNQQDAEGQAPPALLLLGVPVLLLGLRPALLVWRQDRQGLLLEGPDEFLQGCRGSSSRPPDWVLTSSLR